LVALHHACRDLLLGIARRLGGPGAVQALVLPQADRPLPAPRQRVVTARAGLLQDAEHVVAVEDAELRLQAEPLAVAAQDAHAERVEGADGQALRGARP